MRARSAGGYAAAIACGTCAARSGTVVGVLVRATRAPGRLLRTPRDTGSTRSRWKREVKSFSVLRAKS
jgi:hypothetical protein